MSKEVAVAQSISQDLPTSEKNGLVSGCIVTKWVGKWGPYRYAVSKKNGKQTWKYLGRADGLVSRQAIRAAAEVRTSSEE